MKRIDFSLPELQAFVAVAEKLNFVSAAESIYISQPALSRRIDKLEKAIGVRLLERTTRHAELTAAGRQFLQHAYAVIEELQKGLRDIADETSRRNRQVTVACIPSVASSLLPGILKSFSLSHPDTRIHVLDEGAQHVLEAVTSGVADFGLNFLGTQEPDIEFQAIYAEEYCLAVHKQHPLSQQHAVCWEDVAAERFIVVAKSSGNRILVDNAIANLKKRPVAFYETNHVSSALSLVEAGLGIAAVPKLSLVNNIYPSVIGITLMKPTITRTLGLVKKRGKLLEAAARELYECIAHFERELPPG